VYRLFAVVMLGILACGCKSTTDISEKTVPDEDTCYLTCFDDLSSNALKDGTIFGRWSASGAALSDRPESSDESILTYNIPWGAAPLSFIIKSTYYYGSAYNGYSIKLFPKNDDSNFTTILVGQAALIQSKGFWILPPSGKVASGTWALLDDAGNAISFKYTETTSVWQNGVLGPHTLINLKDNHLMLVDLSIERGVTGCTGYAKISIDGKGITDLHGNTQPLYPNNTILVYGKKITTSVANMTGPCKVDSLTSLNIKLIDSDSLDSKIKSRLGI
jgi:hypothetical protein